MKRLLMNFYMQRSWEQTSKGERTLGEAKNHSLKNLQSMVKNWKGELKKRF